jgi:hypothetical protein
MPTLRSSLPFVLFAAAHAAAQDAIPPATDARLLPLHAGATWTYETEFPEVPRSKPVRSVVVDEGGTTLADGRRVHQLRVETEGAPSPRFEHWCVDERGVQRLLARDAAVRGEVDATATALAWLRLDAGDAWQWQGAHDLVRDEQGRPWQHRAEVKGRDVHVRTPAGAFRAVHVAVRSDRDGVTQLRRELWFAPGVGIVRDEHRDAIRHVRRELLSFTPAVTNDRDARVQAFLERELATTSTPAWNNPPYLTWIEDGAEVLALPGRIVVARNEAWTRAFYVDATEVHAFQPDQPQRVAIVARAAFGTESALPPETQPLRPLALLLARVEATRQQLGRIHEVPVSLQPPRAVPGNSHRQVAVELRGGAVDGTTTRVAVWLTLARSTQVLVHSETERIADAGR